MSHLHFGDVAEVELALPRDLAKDGVLTIPGLAVVEDNEELGVVGVRHDLVIAVFARARNQAPACGTSSSVTIRAYTG